MCAHGWPVSSLTAVLKTRVLSYFYFYGDCLLGCSRQDDLLGHRKGHVPRASDLSAPHVYDKEEETQNVLGDDTASGPLRPFLFASLGFLL